MIPKFIFSQLPMKRLLVLFVTLTMAAAAKINIVLLHNGVISYLSPEVTINNPVWGIPMDKPFDFDFDGSTISYVDILGFRRYFQYQNNIIAFLKQPYEVPLQNNVFTGGDHVPYLCPLRSTVLIAGPNWPDETCQEISMYYVTVLSMISTTTTSPTTTSTLATSSSLSPPSASSTSIINSPSGLCRLAIV